MKPYYEHGGIVIYHGDCREILPGIDPADMVLTDPPYDESTHKGALVKSERFKEFGVSFAHLENPCEVVDALLEKTNGWLLIFCSLEVLGRYQAHRPEKYVRGGVWDRISNAPQLSGDRPAQAVEGVAVLHKIRKHMKWQGGGKSAIWRHMVERGQKQHPTQKPLRLMLELLNQFSFDGESVLDPFMGGGTTLVAAKQLNRKAVGIEIDERYCEIAATRLSQEVFNFGESK